jgi:Uma2 family endonuclease
MPAGTLISAEEYLRMPFEGTEPDYVDGILVERSMPNNSHSRILRNIVFLLLPLDQAGTPVSRVEIRLRVGPDR